MGKKRDNLGYLYGRNFHVPTSNWIICACEGGSADEARWAGRPGHRAGLTIMITDFYALINRRHSHD